MPTTKKPARQSAPTTTKRVPRSAAPAVDPIEVVEFMSPEDVRKMLLDLADRIAPGDVSELLRHEKPLRARVAAIKEPHLALFRDQLTLAINCLRDHDKGRCPQIPYFTISLLGGAMWYFVDELDTIPDFLPHIGQLDDAVMLAMAFQLGKDGLRRYCDWKGLHADSLFGAAAAMRLKTEGQAPTRRSSR